MSGDAPVDPAEVPVFTGDLPTLDAKVKALSGDGSAVVNAGSDVHTSFGGLSAFYNAPEADQLFATTKPVADTALDLSGDLCVIAGALGTYSQDAAPLVARLKRLKQDAADFRTQVADDDTWREDGDLIEENLNRRNEIAEVWTSFQEVERACYATIIALVPGGKPLKVNDGSNQPGMYGYDVDTLKQSKSLPWGDAVAESVPWWQVWEHAYDFGKGFIVDGVWGTVKGLGTLVGVDGWDTAGQAWTGLAQLGTGLALTSTPAFWTTEETNLSPWLRDSRRAVKETGKALLAWDQWSENPSRAAGAVTFNVLTTIFTDGTGGAAAGAGNAGTIAKAISLAGRASHFVDPMTYAFKGAGLGLTKIGDITKSLKGLDHINVPALPAGTIHLPEGTVKLPGDGAAPYLDPHGNLLDEDGAIAQHADQAPDPPAQAETPHPETPTGEPALIGATNHAADSPPHLNNAGDGIKEASRAGDHASPDSGGHSEGRTGSDHHPGSAPDSSEVHTPPSLHDGGLPGNEAADVADLTDDAGNPYAHGPHGGWGGSGWVEEPSDYAAGVYESLRATPNHIDIPVMSRHTGVDESVLRQVKSHMIRSQHDVVVQPGEWIRGRFTPRDDIAELWEGARKGTLDAHQIKEFKHLMTHEYVESRLMKGGLPYLYDETGLWRKDFDGTYGRNSPKSLSAAGAHDLAPNPARGGFGTAWQKLGLRHPTTVLDEDLSNIDDFVNDVVKELRAKGVNVK